MSNLNIVFMGTPEFSVPCLKALAESQDTVCAVFTQPDKPKGRGYKMIPTPVKSAAIEYNIPVYQPLSLRKGEDAEKSLEILKEINPDLIIGISGCMSAQEHIVEKIKKSYPQVDIVVGTSAITLLPKLLLECLDGKKFSADITEYDSFSENCEQVRESSFKASVPIMFGCNNFCTYCIVP